MKKHLFLLLSIACPLLSQAQHMSFERHDYHAIGVYDRWEQSPFRDGRLQGHAAITTNPYRQGNPSDSVVAFRRSRWASNIYGARVDLTEPFALSPQGKVIHVLIHRPQGGRVMLVGLGKRRDRSGQSADVEQFWVYSTTDIPHNQWADAIFPVKSASGVDIHSLVVVPDAESPHNLAADWIAYIDDITVNNERTPRTAHKKATPNDLTNTNHAPQAALVTAASRNGTVVTIDGQALNAFVAELDKPFTVRVVPAPGFRCKGLRIRFGHHLAGPQTVGTQQMWQETYIGKQHFHNDRCIIPASCLTGEVEIEGDFVSVR